MRARIPSLSCSRCGEKVIPENATIHHEQELLEALELILPWACKAIADHYNQKIGQRALDKAYSAIAKATGEETT